LKAATSSRPPFLLVKWYTDCVTDSGDVAILYCAEMRWHGFHLSYCNVLCTEGEIVHSRTSLRRFRIDQNDRQINVELPGLKVAGEWIANCPPVEQTIYKSSEGWVQWNCLQPKSFARIGIGDRELAGLGYAERLTLTLPPWQLPMRELRWGRFVSAQDSLVWIDWRGPYSTSLAFHNERKLDLHSISETELAVSGATLHMSESIPIRIGRLAETILPGAPVLRRICPHSVFDIEECKWRSRGVLDTGDQRVEGFVIHEVVHWSL
jgi:hypothetical protein